MSYDPTLNVYEPMPLTPLPLVIETDGESAWLAWDCAVRELDDDTQGAQ